MAAIDARCGLFLVVAMLGVKWIPSVVARHLRNSYAEYAWWSGCRDLNPGPLDPQSSALTKLRHSPSVYLLTMSCLLALTSPTASRSQPRS